MTKIQNRQRAQTNMKTLFVQELWNSRGFIPRTQRKVSGLSVKWSRVDNIIMGFDPANTWLDVHLSSCTSLVLLTSVTRFVTRKFRIHTDFAGLGLATAKCSNSLPQQRRCNAKFEMRFHPKKSKWWKSTYQNKYFWETHLAENDDFLIVKFWNIQAQL